MAYIDCVVDTAPMASTLDTVGDHIDGTSSAVTDMHDDLIEAEKDSADQVCRSVDAGFYNLINSQITSKKASRFTEMNARFTLLVQYSRSLAKAVHRLQDDVSRLQKQYYRVFHGIDRSLLRRIAELDQASIDLAQQRKELILDPICRSVGKTIQTNTDNSRVNNMIVTARLKQKSDQTISTIERSINEEQAYRDRLKDLLDPAGVENPQPLCIPVVTFSSESLVQKDSYITQMVFPDYMNQDTCSTLRQSLAQSQPAENHNQAYNPAVRQEYLRLLESSGLEPHMVDLMRDLYTKGEEKNEL